MKVKLQASKRAHVMITRFRDGLGEGRGVKARTPEATFLGSEVVHVAGVLKLLTAKLHFLRFDVSQIAEGEGASFFWSVSKKLVP